MVRRPKAEAGEPDGEVHEIELDGITRAYDPEFLVDVYTVDFTTEGPEGSSAASVEVTSGDVTTTEIVPTAMGRLHALFAALARQTDAWGRSRGEGKP